MRERHIKMGATVYKIAVRKYKRFCERQKSSKRYKNYPFGRHYIHEGSDGVSKYLIIRDQVHINKKSPIFKELTEKYLCWTVEEACKAFDYIAICTYVKLSYEIGGTMDTYIEFKTKTGSCVKLYDDFCCSGNLERMLGQLSILLTKYKDFTAIRFLLDE